MFSSVLLRMTRAGMVRFCSMRVFWPTIVDFRTRQPSIPPFFPPTYPSATPASLYHSSFVRAFCLIPRSPSSHFLGWACKTYTIDQSCVFVSPLLPQQFSPSSCLDSERHLIFFFPSLLVPPTWLSTSPSRNLSRTVAGLVYTTAPNILSLLS